MVKVEYCDFNVDALKEKTMVARIGTEECPVYAVFIEKEKDKYLVSIEDKDGKVDTDSAYRFNVLTVIESFVSYAKDLVSDEQDDEESEELELYCTNPKCDAEFVDYPIFLNGAKLCPECGEELEEKEVGYKGLDEIRLKKIILDLLEYASSTEDGTDVYFIADVIGITNEELEEIINGAIGVE